MNIKCTQCGCDDCEKVPFPYAVSLITTRVGISGESFEYDLRENCQTQTYICTRCGHYEFYNQDLVKKILERREEYRKVEVEIKKLEEQVSNNNSEIALLEQQINAISKELENLDITIRHSNELKAQQQELTQELRKLLDKQKDLEKELGRIRSNR